MEKKNVADNLRIQKIEFSTSMLSTDSSYFFVLYDSPRFFSTPMLAYSAEFKVFETEPVIPYGLVSRLADMERKLSEFHGILSEFRKRPVDATTESDDEQRPAKAQKIQ